MDRLLNGRRRLDSQGQRLPDEPDVFTFSCRKRNFFCVIIVLMLTIAIAVTLWKTIFEEHNNTNVTDNVCVWNSLNYSIVNGLYSSNGLSNTGYPLYSKTEASTCNINNNSINHLYLFFSQYWVWSISTIPDNTNATSLKGMCASNKATNLTECRSLWQIPPFIPQQNVSVTVTQQCPQTLCPQLTLEYNKFLHDEPCIGIFEWSGTNLYQSQTSENRYVYFNPTVFRWVCGDPNSLDTCDSLDGLKGYAIENSWYDADSLHRKDDHISMPWSNGYTLTMMCTNTLTRYPTLTPTKSPTLEPTTNPTQNPTNATGSPSKSPTKFPSKSPTKFPSKSPTKFPSKSPTKFPSKSPTKSPTGGGGGSGGGGCISSDSFVYMYPDYTKKRITELKRYDKILTYDELNHDFIWDELLVKTHFKVGEYMNDELVPMIEFRLENNNTLTMTGNHLLYVNNDGLKRADAVKVGDALTQFDNGNLRHVEVIDINDGVMKFPRTLFTYSGNLVINNVAISQFTDRGWNVPLRYVAKHLCSYKIYRDTVYFFTKIWNDILPWGFKQYVMRVYK